MILMELALREVDYMSLNVGRSPSWTVVVLAGLVVPSCLWCLWMEMGHRSYRPAYLCPVCADH